MVRVLLADDHQMFAEGISYIIKEIKEVEFAGYASNGAEVISHLEKDKVDIVLLDIDMPGLKGDEILTIIKKRYTNVKVLILTMHDEGSYISHFLDLKVDGYVLKNSSRDELVRAIKTIINEGSYFSSQLLAKVLAHNRTIETNNSHEHDSIIETNISVLTKREKDIVRLTTKEYTVSQIAEELGVSSNTVKAHRKNIQQKLDVSGLAGIIKFGVENKLLD